MRRPFRKFVKDFMLVAGVSLTILAAFNIIVDPYRTIDLVDTPRLDACKSSRGGRVAKAEQLLHGKWDTVILGNSRVDAGIDPANPAWGTHLVFNCGLTGLNFIEEAKIFEFLEIVTKPKTIVLCIDFFHFQDGGGISDEFNFSRFNQDRSLPAHYAEALWGVTPTWHSILTLHNYFGAKSKDYSDLGLRIKPMAPPNQTGRAAFEAYVSHAIETWQRQGTWSNNTECIQRFKETLNLATKHQTKIIVVILPVHALDLEMIRSQIGSPAPLEKWKRDLVNTMTTFRNEHPTTPPIPLWDFTAYTGYTADPIPPNGDPHAIKWYWEPSHFRKELGDLLIDKIQNQPAPDGQDITHFGIQINQSNIESHLARLRSDRQLFAKQFADEIELIEERVRTTK